MAWLGKYGTAHSFAHPNLSQVPPLPPGHCSSLARVEHQVEKTFAIYVYVYTHLNTPGKMFLHKLILCRDRLVESVEIKHGQKCKKTTLL